MNEDHTALPNGYTESIDRGIGYVRQLRGRMTSGSASREVSVARLKGEIRTADALVIGAGRQLRTAELHGGDRHGNVQRKAVPVGTFQFKGSGIVLKGRAGPGDLDPPAVVAVSVLALVLFLLSHCVLPLALCIYILH